MLGRRDRPKDKDKIKNQDTGVKSMPDLQDKNDAKYDSTLRQRIAAGIIDISRDILGESRDTPNHYLRRLLMQKCVDSVTTNNLTADQFLNRALSLSSLTLPIVVDQGTNKQTAPSDQEIKNIVNNYFATPEFLFEIMNQQTLK